MSHDQLPTSKTPETTQMPSIDETIEVPAQHRPSPDTGLSPRATELRTKRRNRNILISTGVGAAGLAAVAALVVGRSGGDSEPTHERSPAASATANPGVTAEPSPTEPSVSETAVPEVIDESYVESVTRNPSPEVIEHALEPISVDAYTAEDAAIRQMNNLKLFWISGHSAWEGGPNNNTETSESQAQREALLDSMFGDEAVRTGNLDILPMDWIVENRGSLAKQLEYVSKESGYSEDSWFNSTTEILEEIETDDPSTVSFRIRNTWQSNIQQIDPTFETGMTWPLSVTDRTITMSMVDGRWVVSELKDFELIQETQVDAY